MDPLAVSCVVYTVINSMVAVAGLAVRGYPQRLRMLMLFYTFVIAQAVPIITTISGRMFGWYRLSDDVAYASILWAVVSIALLYLLRARVRKECRADLLHALEG